MSGFDFFESDIYIYVNVYDTGFLTSKIMLFFFHEIQSIGFGEDGYFPSGSRSCEEGRIAIFHCAGLQNVLDFRFFMDRHFVDLENLFFFLKRDEWCFGMLR